MKYNNNFSSMYNQFFYNILATSFCSHLELRFCVDFEHQQKYVIIPGKEIKNAKAAKPHWVFYWFSFLAVL